MSEKQSVNNMDQDKSKEEDKESKIKIVEGYRFRDEETQSRMEGIRNELEEKKTVRVEHQKEKEEMEILKKEWLENGNLLSVEKQNRLNELEDSFYKREFSQKKSSEASQEMNSSDKNEDEETLGREKEGVKEGQEDEVLDEMGNALQKLKDEYQEKKVKGVLSEIEEEAYRKNIEMLERATDVERMGGGETSSTEIESLEEDIDEGENQSQEEGPQVERVEGEKTPEDLKIELKEARETFAQADYEVKKTEELIKRTGADNKILEESRQRSREKHGEYMDLVKKYRRALIEGGANAQEVLAETVMMEANHLHEAKMDAKVIEKDEVFKEKFIRISKKIADFYRKMDWKKKVLLSGVFAGAAGASILYGGITGAVLLGGGVAGRTIQKTLAGAGAGIATESWMNKKQSEKAEKEVAEQFAENLEERLKKSDKELEDKIFELEGRKNKERYMRYITGGVVGVLVGYGMGKVVNAFLPMDGVSGKPETGSLVEEETFDTSETVSLDGKLEISEEGPFEGEVEVSDEDGVLEGKEENSTQDFSPEDTSEEGISLEEPIDEDATDASVEDFPEDATNEVISEVITEETPIPELTNRIEKILPLPETNTAEIKSGGSVWSTTERYLGDNFGDFFNDMNEGQKTHLIDQIKDRIAEDPAKFGLNNVTNIDRVYAGQNIDFSSILEEDAIKEMFEKAQGLDQKAVDNIIANNEAIKEWVEQNPGASLTTERVSEIISNRESNPISVSTDAVPEFVPKDSAANFTEKVMTGGTESMTTELDQTIDIDEENEGEVYKDDPGEQTTGSPTDESTVQPVEKYSGLDLDIIAENVGGLPGEAIKTLYSENWGEQNEIHLSDQKIDETLTNMFGAEELVNMKGLFNEGFEIKTDLYNNIVISMRESSAGIWNSLNVVLSSDGMVSLDGPLGWEISKKSIDAQSFSEVKNKIMEYVTIKS